MMMCLAANAQLDRGVNQLGGVISVSTDKRPDGFTGNDVKTTIVSLNPTIGKFYRDNKLAGLHLIYYQNFQSTDQNETRALGGGVFFRQYKTLGKSGFNIFAQEKLSVWFEKRKSTTGTNTLEVHEQNVAISIVPALGYGVTKRLQVELFIPDLASIRYQHSDPQSDNLDDSSTLTFSTGISQSIFTNVNVGLTWLF